MNTSLAYKTIGLLAALPSLALAQSNTTVGSFPSFGLDKLGRYFNLDTFYTHDFISNTGGLKAGPRNIGALDLYLDSDLSKYSRANGQIMIHYNHINKNDQRGAIGDVQTASNIDTPDQIDRLTDLWYQHNWNDDLKTLAGFHDISMEFYITESSLNFLNSSFGTGAELSFSGPNGNGPSVYPLTTVGGRGLFQITEELSLRTGVYDADPGGEESFRKMSSGIGGNEGYLHISELAHQRGEQKIGMGAWNYTKSQAHLTDEDESSHSYGAYGMIEREVLPNLWGFARAGWANPSVNPVQTNLVAGGVYRGIFQTKKNQDEIGLGLARAHFSQADEDETAYEGYYQFKAIKELLLRPDLQYITNPAGDKELKNAWAVGLRTVVEI
jgi:porin